MADRNTIKFEGGERALVWKSDITSFESGAVLTVPENREAVLFRDGAAYDLFKGGQHRLDGDRIPLLRRIYDKFTGNKNSNVYDVSVYYVNKTVSEELLWGTNSPIQLEDPKYGILVRIKSFGSYKISVDDSRKFLVKTVGLVSDFSREALGDYFRNELVSRVKVEIAKALVENSVSALEITAKQDVIASAVKTALTPVFSDYGVRLTDFVISTIKADDEDLSRLRRIKEDSAETVLGAMARKQAMDTLGTDYREQETFDVLKTAASNGQNDIGARLGAVLTGTVGGNASTAHSNKCPSCGTENPPEAKFCCGCGKPLAREVFCTECGTKNIAGAKFCCACGHKL